MHEGTHPLELSYRERIAGRPENTTCVDWADWCGVHSKENAMKKLLVLALVFGFATAGLVGCGGSTTSTTVSTKKS
jgi:hypothetical protein